MAELKHFKLPDIGEGLTEADILRWDVAVGDTVTVNQTLVEVETAKAAVELPCPFAGVIHEIFFDVGATVDVGQPIVSIQVGEGELVGASSGSGGEDLVPTPPIDGGLSQSAGPTSPNGIPEREAVLVGYGVSGER
ncbi:MAG: catalytic domain of component of various dehydrogenase complexe, partial [Frankiales bacterium]|nr:catalytic domain of component of various dehydrogenase complexe [Frankiales bacterium]